MSNKEAALIEPLSVSIHVADRANVTEKTIAVILGAGIIGAASLHGWLTAARRASTLFLSTARSTGSIFLQSRALRASTARSPAGSRSSSG